MLRWKFWQKESPRSEAPSFQPEIDWVKEYVTSDFFLDWVRGQIALDEDPFNRFEPSPYYVKLSERAESHKPMEGLRLAPPKPTYVVDDEQPW